MPNREKTEFKVTVQGMELPDEIVERINSAIQKAALGELASLDLRENELHFRPIMSDLIADGGGGGGGGGGAGAGGSGGGGAQLIIVNRA